MARPSEIDQEAAAAVIEAVGKGLSRSRAAALANLDPSTVWHWMTKGRSQKSGPHRAFFNAMRKAEADFIRRNLDGIEEAGGQSWQARAWLMERRFPAEFGQQRLEVAALKRQVAELEKLAASRVADGKAPGP